MKIAIVGGTGKLGMRVTEELVRRGHDVRVLSRKSHTYPVDLVTGEGLETALEGCDTVVDASNSSWKAEDVLIHGTSRLLMAEKAAGIGQHVCVSVVGCDRIPIGYFRMKANQEALVMEGIVPWTIVRSTQFHEYIAEMFQQANRWKVLPLIRMKTQTVSVDEVAKAVADTVESRPFQKTIEVAGPEIIDARDLAKTWKSITGIHGIHLPIPLPGMVGKALRAGAATTEKPAVSGTISFATWLKKEVTKG